jgi:3-oxoadipate enol-lactonase
MMPFAKLPDLELYYEEHGEGEPVLLVPPSWWPCDPWKVMVVPLLSERYKTILFDCRGTGRSSLPHHGYTIEQFAEDTFALLSDLGISRCHVVGFALGGQIAQAMAIRSPQSVATLTMAASGPGNKTLQGGLRAPTEDAEHEIQKVGFERFIRSHVDNEIGAFSSSFYRERPDVVAALGQALWERQSGPKYFQYHHEARRSWDTLANAGAINVPTLIMCGSEDNISRGASTPLATAKRLAEVVPGAELALLPAVKHMTFWDGTAAVTRLVDFLRRHPL